MRIFTSRSFRDTGGSVCLWRQALPIQGPALRPGLGAENVYEMHGCCTGPFEAPGHSCTELSGRLAHSGSLQGASKSSQGYRSPPHPFSWPQDERQEECAPPISANRVSRGSFGFRSDAGPFGSCTDTRFNSMSGPCWKLCSSKVENSEEKTRRISDWIVSRISLFYDMLMVTAVIEISS